MNEAMLEQIVKEVVKNLNIQDMPSNNNCCKGEVGVKDYPLGHNRKDLIRTPTNKSLEDITLSNVINGSISSEDVRISPQTLEYQAQVAESAGRKTFAMNLRRAAELISIPDDRLLEMYNALRPYRSTKQELIDIANELETKHDAKISALLVRQAIDIYEKRNILKK